MHQIFHKAIAICKSRFEHMQYFDQFNIPCSPSSLYISYIESLRLSQPLWSLTFPTLFEVECFNWSFQMYISNVCLNLYLQFTETLFYLHFKQMKSIEPLIYSVHSAFCLNVRMACAQNVTIVVCIAHDL